MPPRFISADINSNLQEKTTTVFLVGSFTQNWWESENEPNKHTIVFFLHVAFRSVLTSPIVSHTDLRAARRRAVPASRQSRMSVNLQAQIRDNSRDLTAFLRDLNEWTGT